jgi:ABC-2 type transport system ATP-binding protein
LESKNVIRVRNLRKKYNGSEEDALKGINLDIGKGDFFGLLGPNAAGKSTLISILCGIMDHTSGDVEIFGNRMNRRLIDFKSEIGLVPQEIALYPSLTVIENIKYFGQLHGLYGQTLKDKVSKYVQLFNLDEHKNKVISKCSGGIKRRINLIAGILHDPSLILLDEPTLGVDPQLRSLIFDFLVRLNQAGATLIYTTHYMKEAEMLCNKISIIDHGSILKQGNPAELIASDPYCNDLGQLFLNLTGRDLRD